MHGLVIPACDVFRYGPEPSLEIRNGIVIRVIIVDPETSSEIYIVYFQSVTFEVCNYFIDSSALQSEHFLDPGDL